MNKNKWILIDCPACGNVNRQKRRSCDYCEAKGLIRKSMRVASTEELFREAEEDAALIQAAIDGELKL